MEPAERRTVRFGAFSFDRGSRLLSRDGIEVPLPPRVLGVLALLVERPGQLVTKQDLMTAVWRDAFVTETSLAEAISVLRQTLGDDPQKPTYIQTLHRRGYRFIAELNEPVRAPEVQPREQVDRAPRLSLLVAWMITLFALLLAASAVWSYLNTAAPPPRTAARLTLTLPAGVLLSSIGAPVAVSADGSLVAFAGCAEADCSIYLRPLSQAEATPVAGTAGGSSPFFSPDGRWLGYFADGQLKKIAIAGGSPIALAPAESPHGATWTRDGHIVFAGSAGGGLSLVPAGGGRVAPLTMPAAGDAAHRWPDALGDGSAVVFTIASDAAHPDRQYAGVVSLRTRAWSRLLDGVSAARVSVPNYLVGQRGRDLVGARFDARALSIAGLPAVVMPAAVAADGLPQFATSASGTLAAGRPGGNALDIVLDWTTDLHRLVPPPQPSLPR